jgi:hypothetical protein
VRRETAIAHKIRYRRETEKYAIAVKSASGRESGKTR